MYRDQVRQQVWICTFSLRVAARTIVSADPFLGYTLLGAPLRWQSD